jgi:hypothetical protein
MNYLETFEDLKDKAEQESANWEADDDQSHRLASAPHLDLASGMTAEDNGPNNMDEARADAAFFDSLDALLNQGKGNIDVEDSLPDFFDGDEECAVQHANEDIHGFKPYLPNATQTPNPNPNPNSDADADANADAELTIQVPTTDTLNNSYIRVVHTNGIHHLAMVTCQCRGEHRITLDLVASNLVPTSFTKICTLFTVQVLDHFWLCNLDLKASAYQFCQLIQRVTLPMRPAEVVNLYHELRHMSCLWRWMK